MSYNAHAFQGRCGKYQAAKENAVRSRLFLTACAAVFLAAVSATAAAPAAPAAAPAPAPAAPAATTSDAQFFAELGYKDVATAGDAARALVILASEGKETGADFDACRTYLRGRGILPDGWLDSVTATEPLDKARLATLICRTLGIKGGLWMQIFGPLPRLALRECVYLELMIRGAEYGHVAGGELVGVIDRSDRWRAKQPVRPAAPAAKPAQAEVKK
jgi:hypothetical protein